MLSLGPEKHLQLKRYFHYVEKDRVTKCLDQGPQEQGGNRGPSPPEREQGLLTKAGSWQLEWSHWSRCPWTRWWRCQALDALEGWVRKGEGAGWRGRRGYEVPTDTPSTTRSKTQSGCLTSLHYNTTRRTMKLTVLWAFDNRNPKPELGIDCFTNTGTPLAHMQHI